MRVGTIRDIIILSMLTPLSIGCKKAHEPEGYRVARYDGPSHQLTIIRTGTFDGEFLTKKLVVVCMFYKWGEHEPVEGPDACHLQVGRLIVPTLEQDPNHRNGEFVTVDEMPNEVLAITEGVGADRVDQEFKVISYEIVNP